MTVFQESALWLNNSYTKNFAEWKITFICFSPSTHVLPDSGVHYFISSTCKYHLQSLVRKIHCFCVAELQHQVCNFRTSRHRSSLLSHQWVLPPVTLFIQLPSMLSSNTIRTVLGSPWYLYLIYSVLRNPWWYHSFPLLMFCSSNLMIMWQGIYFYTNLAKISDWLEEGSLPWEL